ncbi:hypothetical protein LTR70_004791 [Exophiala xenobiotica]|uniref:Uncharacterized protein n=1 Tax=Lithohypha guttulata TaxID=1690604 RepID=A0ABR0KCR4_9EURO|nr:hypothetical protein LTR24_004283 [Lithohypha guttulata]KAK5319881.1 hypothetical protein LTR70_004791 [Exophiala xenobiotica]
MDAPKKYDEDARVLSTVSDLESDADSDSDTLVHSPSAKDQDILNDHDEAERLLAEAPSKSRSSKHAGRVSKGKRRFSRHRRKSRSNEASNLVYEMEEGYKDTSSNSSTDSLLLGKSKSGNKVHSPTSYLRFVLMSASIAALFAILAYGAYRASQLSASTSYLPKQLSNGTHVFGATTILISLDGFRADFLQRGLTPSMNAFVASGVSPQYMLPSFPSVTFPNHYTLVTGLYPESHGIVGNQFWDPAFQEEFYYTNMSVSMQARWWEAAEPIWVTAEKQGIKTAIHMWPGSEAHIHDLEPTYLDKYNAYEQLPSKVDRVLGLLDKKQEERPQLIAAYVPDVDRDGHIMVQLDDIIDMSSVDHIDGWPLRGLRLREPDRDIPIMHEQLLKAAEEHGTFDVHTLDTMPERYHFTSNPRIAPLWVVPKTGWLVIEKEGFDIAAAIEAGEEYHPRGIHGFDHEHPLMRAIFIARGPAFPHAPNSKTPVFQNIEVYNIVCDSLGIMPHSNNGTIRLPMKTDGLHSDSAGPLPLPNDDPADLPNTTTDAVEPSTSSTPIPENEDDASSPTPSGDPKTDKDPKVSWWKYLHEQLQKAKDWAKEVIDSIKNNNGNVDDTGAS